jgi:hypothetical protein
MRTWSRSPRNEAAQGQASCLPWASLCYSEGTHKGYPYTFSGTTGERCQVPFLAMGTGTRVPSFSETVKAGG